jgi:TolB-like protein/tetratricopeptide (TPR) repeat protein
VTEQPHGVFLSYASQDAEAAQRICDALRAAGIEVWFDQSALRGGDVWDQTIRKQIKTCVLFIPVISRHTHERDEGYFRLEWKLAVDRSHLMTGNKAFLLPVVVDDTREDDENVPDKFREVHWTRLPDGETPPALVARIQNLLVPDAPTRAAAPTLSGSTAARASKRSLHPNWPSNAVLWVISALVAVGLAYLIAESFWRPQHSQANTASQNTASSTGAAPSMAAAFNPPPHSIAVLPFINMSGDKDQEFFSDGLSEELLNSLVRINELQVAARTSSFYFKGKDVDLSTVAHKLNVASVLEGSVRRSGHMVRVTAQLNNAITGYHLWSQTYDRDLTDILQMQTEIAGAVATALKVTLLGDLAAKVELGGTRNPAAFDAYIRATKANGLAVTAKEGQAAIDEFSRAIGLDPDYALAYAGRSLGLDDLAANAAVTLPIIRASLDSALADARKSIALAPDLADGHLALAAAYESSLEFTRAVEEYERALTLAPANARVLRDYGIFAVLMGRSDAGLTMLRRAVALDPLNYNAHMYLGQALRALRRYDEAIRALSDGIAVEPNADIRTELGLTQYLLGDLQAARTSCERVAGDFDLGQQCLAITYHKLGQQVNAEAALTKLKALWGDSGPTVYAVVYAQWGDTPKALECLEKAMRLRSPRLEDLKTYPLLDSLRQEPRFQAVMRELKFPD